MARLSIRLRLTAWYSAILALAFCLLGAGTFLALRDAIDDTVDKQLRDRLKAVPELLEHPAPAGDLLRVCGPGGSVRYESAAWKEYPLGPCRPRALPPGGRVETVSGSDRPLRVLSAHVTVQGTLYLVELAAPMAEFHEMVEDFEWTLVWAIPLMLCAASAGGYWMSRRALAPVDRIIDQAQRMGAADLSARLEVPPSGDELARLSHTLNALLGRLEAAFGRVTQFTADASHELRTPVSVIRTAAELALRKSRPEAEYRESLEQILAEAEHTSRLIEDLMTLARADCGAAELPLRAADLAACLRQVCEQGRILAQARQLAFEATLPRAPLLVRGDAPTLARMLLALVDNAVKYTPAGGRVAVSLQADGAAAVAEVRDSGIGISAEDLPRIFERFYRADKAHSRNSGGAGLGLSIAHWIASAHGTAIEVESAPGAGSTFRVRMPRIFRDS